MKRLSLCLLALVTFTTLPLPAHAHALSIALLHTPVIDPVMTSAYGMRTHPVTGRRQFHGAIDLRAKLNQPMESSFDGVVKKAGPRGLLGNAVEVFHPKQNITTIYGHLNRVTVRPGQNVKMGDAVGLAGNTGRSTGVHVHLIVRDGRTTKTLNPLVVLNDSSVPHINGRNDSNKFASKSTELRSLKLDQLRQAAEAAARDAQNYQELLSEGIVSRNDAQKARTAASSAAAAVIACKNSTRNCS